MKKIIKIGIIGCSILISVGFFLLSCAITSEEESLISESFDDSLRVILQIEKTSYQLGTPILMELIVSNEESNEPVKLTFYSSQRYDFIIIKEGEEIWRWSKDKLFAMMLEEIVLAPGESLHYTETWDQMDNKGERVLSGRYEIVGVFKTLPEIISEPAIVEIKPALASSQ